MSNISVDYDVLNQKQTPAFYASSLATRPTFGYPGRIFIDTDSPSSGIYRDTGSAWVQVADPGAGTTGTLQQVTTNGNTTTQGISITAGGLSANTVSVIGGTSSQFLKANGTLDSATYALDSTVVHLAGTETITGLKTINSSIFTSAPQFNSGIFLKEGVFSSAGGFTGLMGNTDGIRVMLGNGVGYHYLHFPTSTANDYTYPATSGTLSLSTSALTAGSVVFVGSGGVLSQDNTNFFFDDTNNFLGIGNTGTPSAPLDIHNGTVGQLIQLNATSTNNSNIGFLNGGVGKWRIGNVYNAGANDFNVYNIGTTSNAISINSTTNALSLIGSISATQFILSGATSPSGLYYNSGINRVTIANYTAGGSVLIETNGGTAALSLASNQAATFSSSVTSQVTANAAFLATSGTTSRIYSVWANTGNNSYFGIESSTGGNLFTGTSAYATVLGTDSARSLQFATNNNIRLAIASTGNVLIGTTTDSGYNLDVNGTARVTSNLLAQKVQVGTAASINDATGVGNTLQFANYSAGVFVTGSADSYIYKTSSAFSGLSSQTLIFQTRSDVAGGGFAFVAGSTPSAVAIISNSGATTISNLAGTGSRAVLADANGLLSAPVSDISVKQNIKPIGYGLNEISKMNPIWFDFIDDYKNFGEGRQNGNIAQEMEAIIPEAVFTTPSTGKMGINYDQLHAIYIKAIQELNEKVNRLYINHYGQ